MSRPARSRAALAAAAVWFSLTAHVVAGSLFVLALVRAPDAAAPDAVEEVPIAMVDWNAPEPAPHGDAIAPAAAPDPTVIAGDEARAADGWHAPTQAPNPDPRATAPAASSGSGAGVAELLLTDRRDAEDLRAQPLDAFAGYQLSRHRTGDERTSFEQVRALASPGFRPEESAARGLGGASHRPGAPATGRSSGTRPADAAGDGEAGAVRPVADKIGAGDGARIGKDGEAAEGFRAPWVTAGPHATDAAREDDRVADDRDRAQVSTERRPGIFELSHPGQRGPGNEGRGDGELPAWARRGRGDEAVPAGSPGAPFGETLAQATYRRRYNEYLASMVQRINPLWEFPHELALRLLQGEVVVAFTVRRDGSVKDLRVVRPSGFDKFDKVVVSAIKRASLPPLPSELGPELRVEAPFEGNNPVVR